MSANQQKAIQITFRGHRNMTYTGTLLLLQNLTSDTFDHSGGKDNVTASGTEKDDYDNLGASYYVIAVVLVYGMSIVMLIASHIKRRVVKVVEDKQIDKYLQDFQIVKERHARDSYRNLKRAVIKKINWERQRKPALQSLQKSIVPLIAIGMSVADTACEDAQSISSSLSNVDLAAAEQYMIAKDKGKMYLGKKTSNAATAEYIAAARRYSRDQSPHSLVQMFRERKISRDYGVHGIYAPATFLDPRTSMYHPHRIRTSSCSSDILVEEDEPGTGESSPGNESTEDEDLNKDEDNSKKGNFLPESQSLPRTSAKKVKVEINAENQTSPRHYSATLTPTAKHELLVPAPWYNSKSEPSGSSISCPSDTFKLVPCYKSQRSPSSGSVPGYAIPASPRESRLSSSPRSTSSILSDGSREELIHITCL